MMCLWKAWKYQAKFASFQSHLCLLLLKDEQKKIRKRLHACSTEDAKLSLKDDFGSVISIKSEKDARPSATKIG